LGPNEASIEYWVGRLSPPDDASATRSGDSELSGTGSGLGLAGLRQRVELMHGTLRAGPTPEGGFRLEAVLPAYVPTVDYAERAAEQHSPTAQRAAEQSASAARPA